MVGWTSRTLLKLAIGIARGFIASGISRTRSKCELFDTDSESDPGSDVSRGLKTRSELYLIEPIGQRLVKTSSQGLTQNYRSVLRP